MDTHRPHLEMHATQRRQGWVCAKMRPVARQVGAATAAACRWKENKAKQTHEKILNPKSKFAQIQFCTNPNVQNPNLQNPMLQNYILQNQNFFIVVLLKCLFNKDKQKNKIPFILLSFMELNYSDRLNDGLIHIAPFLSLICFVCLLILLSFPFLLAINNKILAISSLICQTVVDSIDFLPRHCRRHLFVYFFLSFIMFIKCFN